MVASNESGQSLFEFLLMLPMLVGLTAILVRVNSAIQVSIVNQQYARAQAHFLTFNSSIYPSIRQQDRLIQKGTNQLIIGVSDNMAAANGDYTPRASVQLITRLKGGQASNAPREEPASRAFVRIRNTVTLCTPTLSVRGVSGGTEPILRIVNNIPSGISALGEGTRFDYCGSKIRYEQ